MVRETEDTYGCFRCGALKPTCSQRDEKVQCGECGEATVVTFRQALDMLNNLWLSNKNAVIDSMEYDEYYLPDEAFEEKE